MSSVNDSNTCKINAREDTCFQDGLTVAVNVLSECHPKGTKNLKNVGLLGMGKKQLGSQVPIWNPVC